MAKAPADLRSLARAHTELGIQTLAGIARNSTSDAARVSAAQALLDRGWGKPAQPHTGEDDKDIIHVVIRNVVEERRQVLTSTYRTTPVSDEPLAASQARRLRPPD